MERKQYPCGLVCTIAIHKFQLYGRRSKLCNRATSGSNIKLINFESKQINCEPCSIMKQKKKKKKGKMETIHWQKFQVM